MKLTWGKKGKVITAILLVVSMCFGIIYIPNALEAKATTVETTKNASEVTNGDFESGRDGYSVRNWSKTAMEYTSNTKVVDEVVAKNYRNSYTLETDVEADGNKVASLKKNGSGYVAVTSEAVQVAANEEYRIAFDYKTVEVTTKDGATNGLDYFGVRLLVEELDASGNSLGLKRLFTDRSNTNNWSTGVVEFTTQATTDSVILYLWVGGQWNMYATVHFDNVVLESMDNYSIFNGTFDKATYKADGGRTEGEMGPAGWTVVGCEIAGQSINDTVDYKNYYKATIVDINGNNVMRYSPKDYTTHGYALIQSPFIAIEAGKAYSIQYDFKMDGSSSHATRAHITYYNAQKEIIKIYRPGSTTIQDQDWATQYVSTSDMVTPANTAYMKIGFYAGGAWNKTETYNLYYDNVVLQVEGELSEWTEESCSESGIPNTNNYTGNYDIRKVSDGKEHEDALQLYVSRDSGTAGGVVFYSKPISVTAGKQYTTSFDLKIENSDNTEETNLYGASYVLRYLDVEGNILNDRQRPTNLTGRLRDNMDWRHYTYDFTPLEEATHVQVGLVIGGYRWNRCPDLTHTWDNIVVMESEAYVDYVKDPAVTSSELFKQSALFVGDAIGNGMAEVASSYSEMEVTNACDANVPVEEQLSAHATGEFQYVVVSAGDAEIKTQIPVGVVTDNTVYMNGVNFDATTFAGMLEQLFAKVTEYHEPEKVVYVLPSDNDTYKAIAEAATKKWGVALAVLSDTSDNVKNWNDVIEPAEQAGAFACYNIPGLRVYLEGVVKDIAVHTLSFEQMPVLEALLAKAEGCPTDHAEYQEYMALANAIQTIAAKYDEYRPTICGATIAEGDPNQLRFIAMSAKAVLSEGTQVKKMGILITPDIQGASVMDIEATYTAAATSYSAILSGEDAEPSVVYEAIAYAIYEQNGKQYTFYSNNDYVNALGETTAQNGTCEKSIYGIAKEIAIELSAAKTKDMNFSAIGGVDNKYLIPEATEDSEVSLYDIYRLVSDNADVLKEWLGEGGVSR